MTEERPPIFPGEWLEANMEVKQGNDQRFYSLRELRAAANKACKEACERKREICACANWADLGCKEIREWQTDTGLRGYTAFIEEASPTAVALQEFIRVKLNELGFKDVEVITEW